MSTETNQSCIICHQPIQAGTGVLGIVGGQFPVDDPTFFVIDPSLAPEVYTHINCLQNLVSGATK